MQNPHDCVKAEDGKKLKRGACANMKNLAYFVLRIKRDLFHLAQE